MKRIIAFGLVIMMIVGGMTVVANIQTDATSGNKNSNEKDHAEDTKYFIIEQRPSHSTQLGWSRYYYDMAATAYYPYGSTTEIPDAPFIELWSYPDEGKTLQALTGDVNGDTKLEVVLVNGDKLRVFDGNGTELWKKTISGIDGLYNTGWLGLDFLADVDDDGALEIFVHRKTADTTTNVYVYDGDGTLLKTLTRTCASDGHMSAGAVVDMNNDGHKDVVCWLFSNYVGDPRGAVLFNYTSSNEIWYYAAGNIIGHSGTSFVDINNDGKIEFLSSWCTVHNGASGSGLGGNTTTSDSELWVVVINENGWEIFSRRIHDAHTHGSVWERFVDLDKDGNIEVLAFLNHFPTYPGISEIILMNRTNGDTLETYTGPTDKMWCGCAIVDINNDGKDEIIVGNENGTVTILDYNLNLLDIVNLGTACGVNGVNDINGDGAFEIIVSLNNRIVVLNNNLVELWNYTTTGWATVAISDINGDGVNEIILRGNTLNKFSVLGYNATAPAMGIWAPKTSVPAERGISSAATVDEKIFMIGGNEPKAGAIETDRIDVYYPMNDSWVIDGAPRMPAIRTHLSRNAPVIGDRLYVVGGWNGYSAQSTNFVFNITTNTWSTATPMPKALYGMQQTTYNGKIYSFGGDYGGYGGNEQSVTYEYTPSPSGSGSWTTKASMSTPRDMAAVLTFNNKIYVIGGETSGNTPTNAVEVYDPISNTWETKSSLPFAEKYASGWILENTIYILGWSNKTYRYDSSTDTWAVIGNLPVKSNSFGEHGVAVFDNHAYVFWGNWSSAWTYQFSVIAEKPTEINVAVILAKFNDTLPETNLPDASEFESKIIPHLIRYYHNNSYDSVLFNFTFYNNSNGEWYTVLGNELDYANKAKDFIWDTIVTADEDVNFDEHQAVIAVHPGFIVVDGVYFEENKLTPDGDHAKNWITLSGDRVRVDTTVEISVVIWAHELGHALGEILTGDYLRDRYNYEGAPHRQYGDIDGWGLMGCPRFTLPPTHMCSFSKEYLGWLEYNDIGITGYGDYTLESLEALEYGDSENVLKRNLDIFGTKYYLVEARDNDFGAPGEGIVIYKVSFNFFVDGHWVVNKITSPHIEKSMPTLFNYTDGHKKLEYIDVLHLVKFTLTDQDTSTPYTAQMKISIPFVGDMFGTVLSPTLAGGTSELSYFSYPPSNITVPDIDLHAYTSEGKHVGMNYTSGIYENQIDGAIASGDLLGDEEWIFVPSDVEVRFEVNSHDTGKFLEEYPEFAENITEQSFSLTYVSFDENGNRFETLPQCYEIVPNATVEFKAEYRNINELVTNFNAFKEQSVKVNGTVTAVYSDRFFIQNENYGIMVYTGGNATVAIGDKGRLMGVVDLIEKERSILYQTFEKIGSEVVAKYEISTGNVTNTYNEKGSILVHVKGEVKEIGSDYVVINDGSGDANIYFKYGIAIPECEAGNTLEVTGILINDAIGILPVDADSITVIVKPVEKPFWLKIILSPIVLILLTILLLVVGVGIGIGYRKKRRKTS